MSQPNTVCGTCMLPITNQEWTNGKGTQFQWHKDCFRCAICKADLNNKDYALSKSTPFCLDHPEDERIPSEPNPKCMTCGVRILFENPVRFQNGHHHKDCLMCATCGKNTEGKPFNIEGNANCRDCYAESCAKYCSKCNQKCVEKVIQTPSGALYCQNCFRCKSCRTKITSKKYYELLDELYCTVCERTYYLKVQQMRQQGITGTEGLIGEQV